MKSKSMATWDFIFSGKRSGSMGHCLMYKYMAYYDVYTALCHRSLESGCLLNKAREEI